MDALSQELLYFIWEKAVATACCLQNRLPITILRFQTPLENWPDIKPDLSNIKIFDSVSQSFVPKAKRNKLEGSTTKQIFFRYGECSSKKGCRLNNPTICKFQFSIASLKIWSGVKSNICHISFVIVLHNHSYSKPRETRSKTTLPNKYSSSMVNASLNFSKKASDNFYWCTHPIITSLYLMYSVPIHERKSLPNDVT